MVRPFSGCSNRKGAERLILWHARERLGKLFRASACTTARKPPPAGRAERRASVFLQMRWARHTTVADLRCQVATFRADGAAIEAGGISIETSEGLGVE